MNISSLQGVLNLGAYNQVNSSATDKSVAELSTPVSTSQGVAKAGVQVTLTANARPIAMNELPGWVKERSDALRNNPNQAEAMGYVQSMATIPGGALVSYGPNSDGITDVYYAATGLPVTPESTARHDALVRSITAGTTAIFNAESAKGTPPPLSG